MVDLRFIERDGKKILQWRTVPVIETLIDGKFVARVETTSFPRLMAWTKWADVPFVAQHVTSKGDENGQG